MRQIFSFPTLPKSYNWFMHRKKILTTVGLLLALLLMAVFLPSRNQPSPRSIKLPDGSSIRVEKVTFGTRHSLRTGSALGKLWQTLAPHLPPVLRNNVALHQPKQFGTYVTGNTSLGIWLYRTASPSNQFLEDTLLEVTDQNGVVHLPGGNASYSPLGTNWIGERMEKHFFKAFPRRAKILTFHVYSVGVIKGSRQWVHAGCFQVPNPTKGPFPAWTPEPLPAKRVNGDLELTLIRLAAKTNSATKIPRLSATNLAGTEAHFQITHQGTPATDWQVESLQLSDSTDNSLYLWCGDGGVSSNGFFFVPRFWLAPEEPWKVSAEVTRRSGFAPDELGTLENVPVNFNSVWPAGSTNRNLSLKGKTISLQNLRWESNWRGNAALELSVTPATKDSRIRLVKVTDQNGNELTIARPPPGYGDFRGYGTHFFGLNIPSDAPSLNLTFAYQECRFAEFVAQPVAENAERQELLKGQ